MYGHTPFIWDNPINTARLHSGGLITGGGGWGVISPYLLRTGVRCKEDRSHTADLNGASSEFYRNNICMTESLEFFHFHTSCLHEAHL